MEFLKNIKPREYQERIFATCAEKNCLVILPTGLGKTLIALMLTIHRLKQFPTSKVLFLAPTRPLAEQHLKYFQKNLPELFAEMNLFTGQVNANERKNIWETTDIIFSTPQCIANDLKNNLYNLKKVCLLIEDEAHRCVKNYDYTFVAKSYIQDSENPRIIGLTASPGSDFSKVKEICKNLSIEEVELRTRNSPDVKEYLQELEFQKILIDFPPELQELRYTLQKIFNNYIEELRQRGVLYGIATKSSLIELQKKISHSLNIGNNRNFNYMLGASACAQAIKIQHALEVLETQTLEGLNKYLKTLLEQANQKKSKGVIKLTSSQEFNFIFMKTNELMAKNFEHPKVAKITELIKKERELNKKLKIMIFTQFRDTASIIAKNINQLEGIKAKVFVGQAKKNDTGLSQKDQKKMIEEFSVGEINVLCATCIGEEGLDIPEVNAVIFYEPVASAIRTIQRTGRTARLMPGKLMILVTKKTRDESSYYASRARERKMHSVIENVKENLKISQDIQKQNIHIKENLNKHEAQTHQRKLI